MIYHHDTLHLRCCLKPLCGRVFWLAAFISLVLAWIAVYQGLAYGFESEVWFNTGILLVLLAIGLKGTHNWHSWLRPGHHGHCNECAKKIIPNEPSDHH